jgi:hypothetical protein
MTPRRPLSNPNSRSRTARHTRLPAIRGCQAIHRAAFETLEERRLLSFSAAVPYAAGANPQDVVAADVNADGRRDLIATNNTASTVSVLLGNANGTFQAALTSATRPGPVSVAVGDFNTDGKMDLATSNNYEIGVMLGNGNGTFQTPSGVNLGAQPTGVAVGDFNADGKLDLAAASNLYYPGYWGYYGGFPGFYSGRVNVLLGNGSGSFAAPSTTFISNGNYLSSVAVADFNADGKQDVATADTGYFYGGAHALVAFGDGAGGIASVSHLSASNASPYSVSAGDINGDGKPDLVTSNLNENTVGVIIGNGAGGFAAPLNYASGPRPAAVDLADFNGDGRVDIITANSGDGTASVLLNAGTGAFPPVSFATGSQPSAVSVGDFNGDGRIDAAVSNAGSGNAAVLLNDGAWPDANAPLIRISDVTVTEGNSGTVNAALNVTLSKASTQTVTVNYATVDGSATSAGNDYVAVLATQVAFAPGELSKTINLQVKGDTVVESAEAFNVVLSGATNSFVSDASGAVTILDDEPGITIDDVTLAEGNTGTKSFTFTLRLSAATTAPVSVKYSTVEGDTDFYPYNPYSYYYGPPAATAGSDFTATTGTATIPAGQTSTTVTVVVAGDRTGESDEAFSLNLSDAVAARISDDHAVGMILNDDPYVSVVGGSVTEGDSGTKVLPFTITLSTATDVAVTVNYNTSNGTAASGSDYVAKSSSVTFAAGETSKTVDVTVNGDTAAESDEYFTLLLGTVTNAGVATGEAYGYILDDDISGVSISNASITEGDKGTRLMTFTVSLTSASDQALTVNYATQNGSASPGKDYSAKSGTITFAAGETSKTITVSIKGDRQREADENFFVVLSNASVNAAILDGSGVGTILNDDFR